MLLLKDIHLLNFLSHEDTLIEFGENSKVLINGVSGAGKSSVIDAIIWCLYGEGRSDNRSLISRGKEKMRVVLTLSNGENTVKVDRRATKSGKNELVLMENGAISKVSGLKGTQEYLENKILGASYLLFVNSVASPQENVESFVKQTASKRKDIIMEIIRATDYDNYLDIAKELIKNEKFKIESLENEIRIKTEANLSLAALADRLPEIKTKIKTFTENLSALNAEREWFAKEETIQKGRLQDLSAKNATVAELERQMGQNTSAIQVLEQKIKESKEKLISLSLMENKIAELPALRTKESAYSELAQKAAAVQAQKNEIMKKFPMGGDMGKIYISRLTEDLEKINKKLIELLSQQGRVCPATGKECPYSTEDRDKKVKELTDDVVEKEESKKKLLAEQQEYTKLLSQIVDVEINYAEWDSIKKQIRELESVALELERTKQSLSEVTEAPAKIDALKKDISDKLADSNLIKLAISQIVIDQTLSSKIIENQSKISIHNMELGRLSAEQEQSEKAAEKISEFLEERKSLEKEMVISKTKLESLEMVKLAFGDKGLKTLIIDYVLPQLEDKINEILSKLSDFRVSIETQKSNVSGENTLEGLFITITNGQGESLDINNYSGGEKTKITTAISEGLASLQKVGFRIFDESIVGLDGGTIESYSEVMMNMRENISQMICISHIQQIKDMFDEQITIVKKNGTSYVKK